MHCGAVDTAVPHHRLNRGMGGSKVRDVPSNIVTMCAAFNGVMESDSDAAELAREYGWKLRYGADPAAVPIWNVIRGEWLILGDDFSVQTKL